MTLKEILLGGGGGAVILMTLIQFSPLKINPWSALWAALRWLLRSVGAALNAEVLDKLATLENGQRETREKLDAHIQLDDKREADKIRAAILKFNNELLRAIPHTKEEFIEILLKIDEYEAFCRDHEDYKNSRAIHAIANIGRVYDERLQKHDFL